MENFTKGGWIVDVDNCCEKVVIGLESYNENPASYYACHKIIIDCDDEEAVANACLIAAAPKMYNMLNLIAQGIEDHIKDSESYNNDNELKESMSVIRVLLKEAREGSE